MGKRKEQEQGAISVITLQTKVKDNVRPSIVQNLIADEST
jgi:hypothetical protein